MTRTQIINMSDDDLQALVQEFLDYRGKDEKIFRLYARQAMKILSEGELKKIYFTSNHKSDKSDGFGSLATRSQDSISSIDIDEFIKFLIENRGGITSQRLGII